MCFYYVLNTAILALLIVNYSIVTPSFIVRLQVLICVWSLSSVADIKTSPLKPIASQLAVFQLDHVPYVVKSFYHANSVSEFQYDRYDRSADGTKSKENEFKVNDIFKRFKNAKVIYL